MYINKKIFIFAKFWGKQHTLPDNSGNHYYYTYTILHTNKLYNYKEKNVF